MEAIIIPLLASAGASAGTITAAGAIGTSGLFTGLSALGSVVSGISQYSMAQAQAEQARLRAEAQAIQYRQQGVAALDRTLSTAATIAARAGAGSVDPFSGSAGALTSYAYGKGFGEFTFAQESAEMARLQGGMQAGLYQMSGEQSLIAGIGRGFSSAFTGYDRYQSIGGRTVSTSLLNYPSANVPEPPIPIR